MIVLAGDDVHQLGQRARAFDAGGTAANYDEGEQGAPGFWLGLRIGTLEAGQHVVAHPGRIRQRLQTDGDPGHRLVAEIIVDTAGRQYEVVEGQLRAISQTNHSAAQVDAVDRRLSKADVARPAEDRAQGIGDVAGIEQAGRHLVEEGSEEVEVMPVEQQHLHGRAVQLAGAGEAAEAGSDDHDTLVSHRRRCAVGRAPGGGPTPRPRASRRART